MKKIVSILSTIFLLSATLSSCTDLEENPYSSIPSDEFFNNEEEFLMSAGRIYAYLVRYTCYRCIWGTISVSTDEAVSPLREGNQWVDDGVWRDMHAHTWNSQMQDLQTIWEFLFGGISLCNQILYEFDQSSVDFEAKPSLVAEVLVMRAWFYLNAMDLFGNVPFTTDFSDTSLPRQVDRKFLFSFIEQQIKDNVGLLQDVPTASNYGRVTKAMAYTTLAKLYINAQYIAAGRIASVDGKSYFDLNTGNAVLRGSFSTLERTNSTGTYRVFFDSGNIACQKKNGDNWDSIGFLSWNYGISPPETWIKASRVDVLNSLDTPGVWLSGTGGGKTLYAEGGLRRLDVDNINGYNVQWYWDSAISKWVLGANA